MSSMSDNGMSDNAADAARDTLRERIRAFVEATTPDPLDLRGAARELGLLPLMPDHVGVGANPDYRERWYGVRPDGQVVSFSTKPPRDPRPPESRWRELWVLAQAREGYGELNALIPPRPRDAPLCPRCDGAGRIHLGVSDEIVTCVCGGLGWIQPTEDDSDGRHQRKEEKLGPEQPRN